MIDNLNKLKGGIGDSLDTSKIDPIQLSLGIQIEMEHTNDPKIAQEITIDHLKFDPEYYLKLVKAGLTKEFQPTHNTGFGDPDYSFNDEARTGYGGLKKGNMHGKIGETPNGKVDGRNSEPIVNKTVDIELEEKKGKKKPKPTNPALWAACKAWARRTFDVYPSAYANGAAAKRYKSKGGGWRMSEDVESGPIRAYDGPFPAQVSSDGQGTYGNGYDFVGFAENKGTIMKKEQLKEAIKRLVKQTLFEQEQNDVDIAAEDETVTITLNKALAQKLHDLLITQLSPKQSVKLPASDEPQSVAPTKDDNQLPSFDGELETSLDEITFERSNQIEEIKGKLVAATKKGGKIGQRARLAQTLGKITKKKNK